MRCGGRGLVFLEVVFWTLPVVLKTAFFAYRTRAIISRGLYIFYPISKDHCFVFKEVFSAISVLMDWLYLRAASNQKRLMMARVRYIERNQPFFACFPKAYVSIEKKKTSNILFFS